MKIPTLLGITLLLTLIASGFIYYFYLKPASKSPNQILVSDLQVVNVFNNAVTIVWQTNSPSIGTVSYSTDDSFEETGRDNRDRTQKIARRIHFVTLNSLQAGTDYKFKIFNNDEQYSEIGNFKTADIPASDDNQIIFSFPKPLKGTVLNTNFNPVDESLIFLDIPGAQPLATFSSTSGNFILPLKTILNKEKTEILVIESGTNAEIRVLKGANKADVKIKLTEEGVNLPPITIGTSLNLINYKKEPISKINFGDTIASINYDFNNDSRINSLDLAILREAASSKNTAIDSIKRFDLNFDGIIDQSDVEVFSRRLTGNPN